MAPPTWVAAAGPLAIDAMLAGLAAIAPVAPDRFFALHYSKLAAQSRETLAAWSARGAMLGLATGALDDLRERLEVARDPDTRHDGRRESAGEAPRRAHVGTRHVPAETREATHVA